MSRRIGAKTGGIRANFMSTQKFTPSIDSSTDNLISLFLFRGKAVRDKSNELFHLMNELVSDAKLDNQKKAVEILKEHKIQYENAVISSGHSFANTRIASRFSLGGYLNEITGGVSYLQSLGKMIDEAENNWPLFLSKLETMREKIFNRNGLVINLTGDEKTLDQSRSSVERFINSQVAREYQGRFQESFNQELLFDKVDEGLVVPTQVNYVGMGGQVFRSGETVPGSSVVVSKFLSTGYMWNNVRVMGGAYGGFASFGPVSGRLAYLSYRDPNLVETLNIYNGTGEYLSSLEITDDMVEKAVIGAIGDMDSPRFPDQEGFSSFQQYIRGESQEDRQKWRNEVLATSPEDFKRFGERLMKLEGTVSIVASEDAVVKANEKLQVPLKVIHIVKPEENNRSRL